jgi:hypothetical protein
MVHPFLRNIVQLSHHPLVATLEASTAKYPHKNDHHHPKVILDKISC